MYFELPAEAPCSWSDETLFLRYAIPKNYKQNTRRPFGIYWSENLSYGRLWPEPTAAELDSFYDVPEYSEYLSGTSKEQVSKPSLLWRALTKIAWLNDHGVNDALSTILSLTTRLPEVCDIGCGSGRFLARAREYGAKPTGIDPSPVSAKSLRSKEIEFHLGTAEALPSELADRRFDVVSMFQSLEHCREPAVAISNAVSLLKPDGLLVIDVPNMDCVGFKKYGPVWWHTDAGRHLHFFTKASLTMLLIRAGMEPIEWEFQGFVTQFTQSWINDMAEVWEISFKGRSDSPPKPSALNSLSYLPRALLSEKSQKYEVIRVYAKPLDARTTLESL